MFEPVSIEEQQTIAIDFLVNDCHRSEKFANNNWRRVELYNTWDSDENAVGYYELSDELCVLNADELFKVGITD